MPVSRQITILKTVLKQQEKRLLANAFMASRLDYCNALMGGCPARL